MLESTRSAGPIGADPYSPYGDPSWPGYPGYSAPAADPPPVKHRSSRWRVALIVFAAIATVPLTGALANYLVPRALSGGRAPVAVAPEVTVTLPTHLHGWTKLEGKRELQLIRQVTAKVPSQMHPRGAVYGRAGVYQAIVIVEPYRLSAADQKELLAQDVRELKPHKVTMRAVPAGPLGGQMQCGRAPDGTETDCDFVDDGLYGFVALAGHPQDYHATVLAIRAAVEHRLG